MIPFNPNIFPETKGAYIVGGTVRDLILGRSPADYDIAVLENPKQFAKKVSANTAGRLVVMGKPGQMIFRVVSSDGIFDISPAAGRSIEDDLKKRDFTINAIAYSLFSGKLIDPLGGLQDISGKKIRIVSKDVFRKDPVRLIRAYRIGALLDFGIDPRTKAAIKKDANRIQNSAGERIREELFKMLRTSNSHYYLSQMVDTGLLLSIFPELGPLKGCCQNRHHLCDVFEHTLKSFYHLETLLNDPGQLMPKLSCRTFRGIGEYRAALLKCAILLHDIGKPSVRSVDRKEDVHFYGHGKKGAEMATNICQRLKLSNREKRFIDFIVRNHMRPLFLFTAHQKNTLTQKGKIRFFIKCGDSIPDLFLHSIADFKGKDNKNNNRNAAFVVFARDMIRHFYATYKPKTIMPPLVTGDDLIAEFKLAPSPLFKKILKIVEESRFSNQIKTKKEALKLIEDFLNTRPTKLKIEDFRKISNP